MAGDLKGLEQDASRLGGRCHGAGGLGAFAGISLFAAYKTSAGVGINATEHIAARPDKLVQGRCEI